MQPDTPARPAPDPGLPPVTPPSGSIILRDFLVPGLIVALLVCLFLAGPTLYGWVRGIFGLSQSSAQTAADYLRRLKDPNPEVRWRGAADLAQYLPRDKELAADADFALELAGELQHTRDASASAEKAYAERVANLSPGEREREEKKLEQDRIFVKFLSGCLASFAVPVGAPLLEEMAGQEGGMEPEALMRRREYAVLALATLGNNLKTFDELPAQRKDAIEGQLEAAAGQDQRGRWARGALEYLKKRRQGKQDTLGVAAVLVKCSRDPHPYLRELAAAAMNSWSGTAAENAAMDDALADLLHDDGRGEDQLAQLSAQNQTGHGKTSVAITTRPGFRVRANADVALAHRGSPKADLDLLRDMLDEDQLRKVLVLKSRADGSEQPDEGTVQITLVTALDAVADLHAKRPDLDLSTLRPLVDRLAQHSNTNVRYEAQKTQMALAQK